MGGSCSVMGKKLSKGSCLSRQNDAGAMEGAGGEIPAQHSMFTQEVLFTAANPCRVRTQLAERGGPEGWYRVRPPRGWSFDHIVIHDPDLARSVLSEVEDGVKLWKTPKGTGVLDACLGFALTSADPEDWRRQRPLVCKAIGEAQTFETRFWPIGRAAGEGLAAELLWGGTQEINLKIPVQNFSVRAITHAVLGEREADAVGTALLKMWRNVRMQVSKRPPTWKQDCRANSEELLAVVQSAAKRLPHAEHGALLQRLLWAGLPLKEAVGNALSFLIAGYEAINCATLFALLHLAADPERQRLVAAECFAQGPQSSRAVVKVVNESLRLYPPVMSLPRVVKCPMLEMCGMKLRQGTRVTVCTAAPSRRGVDCPFDWDAGRPVGASSMCPFGLGIRQCPGGQIGVGLVREIVGRCIMSVVLSPGKEPDPKPFMRDFPHAEAVSYPWEVRLRQTPTMMLAGPAMIFARERSREETTPGSGIAGSGLKTEVMVTKEELEGAAGRGRTWTVIRGCVYDVSDFLHKHPGGERVLKAAAGLDSTSEFERLHSATARAMLKEMYVGRAPEGVALLDGEEQWVLGKIEARQPEGCASVRLTIRLPAPVSLGAGGHFSLKPCGDKRSRSYTPVAGEGDLWTFVIKAYPGGVSEVLHIADEVEVSLPQPCRFCLDTQRHRRLLLVAGGTGAAPMLSLARAALAEGCEVFAVLSDKTPEEAILPEFDALPGLHLRRVYTRVSDGCRITASDLPPPPGPVVVCGPPGFSDALPKLLASAGHDDITVL